MLKTRLVGRSLLVGAAVIACVRPSLKPPVPQDFRLGALAAPVRDYAAAKVDVCAVEPAALQGDLMAMDSLLESFLQKTSAGREGFWAPEQVALLEDAQKRLPAALDTFDATLSALSGCKLDPKLGIGDLAHRGREFSRLARKRIADAPALLPAVRHHQAVEKWKKEQAEAREQERQNWCPPGSKPRPDVFYAWEDEGGRIEWYFCDGGRVVAEPGFEIAYVPPPEGKGPRPALPPAGYIKTAKKFPDSEIKRLPPELSPGGQPSSGG